MIQLNVDRVFSFSTQLNLTGHCNGLTTKEIKDLWVQADIDGNGLLDYKEFQVTFQHETPLSLESCPCQLISYLLVIVSHTHVCSIVYVTHCSKEYGTKPGRNREMQRTEKQKATKNKPLDSASRTQFCFLRKSKKECGQKITLSQITRDSQLYSLR